MVQLFTPEEVPASKTPSSSLFIVSIPKTTFSKTEACLFTLMTPSVAKELQSSPNKQDEPPNELYNDVLLHIMKYFLGAISFLYLEDFFWDHETLNNCNSPKINLFKSLLSSEYIQLCILHGGSPFLLEDFFCAGEVQQFKKVQLLLITFKTSSVSRE